MSGQNVVDGGDGKSVDRFSRVFDVLELLVHHPEGLTLTDISRRLQLPTSSTHNLLQRMVANETLLTTLDLRYIIGARAVRLGIRIADGLEVRQIARRYLQDLARETGEDAYLAVGLGKRVTYVDRVQGTQPVTIETRLGQSLFLHATSVGKLYSAYVPSFGNLLLSRSWPALTEHTLVERADLEAELIRIREMGYATSVEESFVGVIGLAVPARDAAGNLAAAIHMSILRTHSRESDIASFLQAAQAAAAGIEHELGRTRSTGSLTF